MRLSQLGRALRRARQATIVFSGRRIAKSRRRLPGERRGANRIAAAAALCKIDVRSRSKYIGAISSDLSDKEAEARFAAACFLREFPDDSAATITALAATLKDKDDGVRWMTCQALEALGPRAVKLGPILMEIAKNDTSPSVRQAAGRTVHMMRL